ncbi:hypothetical protein Dimus_025990 [Dionaea muscipula]
MGFQLPSVISIVKRILKLQSPSRNQQGVPKGHISVYVGEDEERKRYVVPLSYLSQPLFQELLNHAEEEFGFKHPMGGLTLPCKEQAFIDLTCRLRSVQLK